MSNQPPQILLTTIGTSLLGNLNRAPETSLLKVAFANGDAGDIARQLAELAPNDRTLGAEICSICNLITSNRVSSTVGIYLFHSATDEGRLVANVLTELLRRREHSLVEAIEIEGLQEESPERFRAEGLRNLARQFQTVIQQHGAQTCAFNATGGYKAQIAVAVLMGQALGIPTFYLHERFSEIIEFPPQALQDWLAESGQSNLQK